MSHDTTNGETIPASILSFLGFSLESFDRVINHEHSVDLGQKFPVHADVFEELTNLLGDRLNSQRKAVLGIDIRGYSAYPVFARRLVPTLFRHLLGQVVLKVSKKREQFLFQFLDQESIQKRFIDTGDGGFLILDNPLQALAFALHLEWYLQLFNTDRLYREVHRAILGKSVDWKLPSGESSEAISCRFALSFDEVYVMNFKENPGAGQTYNYYGQGIIDCSRIMSLDKSTRLLSDQNTCDWFSKVVGGFENIPEATIENISKMDEFSGYIFDTDDRSFSFFRQNHNSHKLITSSSITRGEKEIKGNRTIPVFNLFIQARSNAIEGTEKATLSINLGKEDVTDFF